MKNIYIEKCIRGVVFGASSLVLSKNDAINCMVMMLEHIGHFDMRNVWDNILLDFENLMKSKECVYKSNLCNKYAILKVNMILNNIYSEIIIDSVSFYYFYIAFISNIKIVSVDVIQCFSTSKVKYKFISSNCIENLSFDDTRNIITNVLERCALHQESELFSLSLLNAYINSYKYRYIAEQQNVSHIHNIEIQCSTDSIIKNKFVTFKSLEIENLLKQYKIT